LNMAGSKHARNRGGAVIIQEDQVAVIKRIRDGKEYYVFPGGGIEEGESPVQATIREAFEELGVHIVIIRHLETVEFHGMQHYFLAHIVGGTFGTGQGEEYDGHHNRGLYEPMWLPITKLEALDVRPMEIVKKCMEQMET
jgi:8-oxo-dGTP diphosphatase